MQKFAADVPRAAEKWLLNTKGMRTRELATCMGTCRFAFLIFFLFSLALKINARAEEGAHSDQGHMGAEAHKATNAHSMTSGAEGHAMPMGPKDCSEMTVWDYSFGSCIPVPTAGMPMRVWMLHGNAFLVQTLAEGPRGRNELAAPNMVMGGIGQTIGGKHYFNLNVMLTFERWTFPERGYPELLQIGERDASDRPYIDAQHPHSSPIMGLTLSDTIRLGDGKDHLNVFFAPRGQATEGPTAFMHRPSAMINPDAPLGHHIGQDVSHITSTVLGASLGLARTRIEASAFNGAEPEPSHVDLPLGPLNSYAGRFIYEFSDNWSAMASTAYVKSPEPHGPAIDKVYRYSASIYNHHKLGSRWMLQNSFIFGLVNYYDNISALRSFLEEFWIHSDRPYSYWGRVEFVERAPAELAIAVVADPLGPRWVTALTAGYTHDLFKFGDGNLSAGVSATKSFVPGEFESSYRGDPWSGRVFLQLTGMKMGDMK